MRIAIVGGGAAGLTAAITAARPGIHIDLYEKQKEPGKKILASGNGRCNVSNTSLDFTDYYGRHPAFVTHALKRFGYAELERFFLDLGVLLRPVADGRVYPLSNEAKTVFHALEAAVRRRGVNLLSDRGVASIERTGEGFVVASKGQKERYDRVLIAAGSPAAPQLGGGEGGLRLAEALGHETVPFYPTLVGLHLPGRLHERVAGVKLHARLTLYVDGRVEERVEGDLLFTRYGISGFAVLDISTSASRALLRTRNVTVGIHLLPEYDRQGVVALLQKLIGHAPQLSQLSMLHALMPRRLAEALLRFLKMEGEEPCSSLGPKELRRLASTIADWRFSIIDTHGFRHAETAGGGVATEQVEATTMESKIVPGLYFAGEVLDIVGRRGGYNLHFAFASGHMAAKAMLGR
ncbi:NAD(P)/FAD-dependent oxidoreductase [Hydrogenimonas sp.]